MGIEGLNRFHWMIIGTLLGVAIAYVWVSSQEVQGQGDAASFQRDVAAKDPKSGNPLIKGIVIHPAQVDYQNKTKVLVTYKRLNQHIKTQEYWWVDKHFYADVPFRPSYRQVSVADPANLTIQTYLTELAKQPDMNFVQFNDGWLYIPQNAMLAGGGAGLVLIGGIWPTLLSLMINAGFGRRITAEERKQIAEDKAKQKANSPWRIYKSKSAPAPSGASNRKVMTAADQEELLAVANAYERSIGPGSGVQSGTAVAQSAELPSVKNLDAKALDDAPKLPGADDEIEVKNREYYPTLVHHHKDEKKQDVSKKGG